MSIHFRGFAQEIQRSQSARPSRTKRPNNALLLIAIVLVALSLRPGIASLGPSLPYIISDFNLSHTEASFIGAIPPLLMGLLAFPVPRLARRFGLDIVLVIAVAICGFSGAARGWASNGLEFLLATAGVGAGIAVAQTLLGGVIKTAFPNNTSLVMSLYAATLSSGAAVSALVTQQLISLTGHWSLAMGVCSCVSLVAALAWAFIKTREHRPDVHHRPSPPIPASAIRAWQIALYFTITGILFYALLAWLAPLYCELGLPASQAASAVAVFSAAFMVGNLLMGWFSRARDRRLWLFLSSLCASMGLIALAIAPMHLPFVVVSACGVGLGGSFTLGLTIVLDNTRSAEEADQWNAFVMGIGYSIAGLGPVIFGYSHDAFGSYHIALWCCAAISMLAVPITFVLRPLRFEPSAD